MVIADAAGSRVGRRRVGQLGALATLFIANQVQRAQRPAVLVLRAPRADQLLLAAVRSEIVGEAKTTFADANRPVLEVRADVVKAGRRFHIVLFVENVAGCVRDACALSRSIAGSGQSADLEAEVE